MIMSLNEPAGTTACLDDLSQLFRLLSDRTRLQLLLLLSHGERNVTSLCEELRMPQPTVSHHLGLLRMNGLVTNRRAGKQIFYGLDGRVQSSAPGPVLSVVLEAVSVRIACGGEIALGATGDEQQRLPELEASISA